MSYKKSFTYKGIKKEQLLELATIDSEIGIIPILSSINDNKFHEDFDLVEFLIKIRANMILEENYNIINNDKRIVLVKNTYKPEQLILGKSIRTNRISPTNKEKIFSIVDEYFSKIHFPYYRKGIACVKKMEYETPLNEIFETLIPPTEWNEKIMLVTKTNIISKKRNDFVNN